MKKILISLIAVAGLLVAGNNTAKEVKICDARGMLIKKDDTAIFPNMREMACFSYEKNSQKLSHESFQKLYENGWGYAGTYSAVDTFEDKVKLPNEKERESTFIVFERNK